MYHPLKTDTQSFQAVATGVKRAEFRKHDRPFSVGDTLILNEINAKGLYTQNILQAVITDITSLDAYGAPGYALLSITDVHPLRKEVTFDYSTAKHNHPVL